jgi:hypothetical protein
MTAAFAAGSFLIGICAAMPPIACAPRAWHVRTTSCVYARMKGCSMVSVARSGKRRLGSARSVFIAENR